jgi:hypothetical protein
MHLALLETGLATKLFGLNTLQSTSIERVAYLIQI